MSPNKHQAIRKPTEKELRFAVLATDIVVFRFKDDELQALLIDVYKPSVFIGKKAFPGGLIRPDETAEQSVRRLLEDKGGLEKKSVHVEQLYTFSKIDRDPRGRVVSVAYMGIANVESVNETEVRPGWVSVKSAKKLAYDHDEILEKAVERLKSKLRYTTIAQFLLPKEFTLTELERLYEVVLNRTIDKRNFRKKILKLGVLKDTGKKTEGLQQRPAALYSFASKELGEEAML